MSVNLASRYKRQHLLIYLRNFIVYIFLSFLLSIHVCRSDDVLHKWSVPVSHWLTGRCRVSRLADLEDVGKVAKVEDVVELDGSRQERLSDASV